MTSLLGQNSHLNNFVQHSRRIQVAQIIGATCYPRAKTGPEERWIQKVIKGSLNSFATIQTSPAGRAAEK